MNASTVAITSSRVPNPKNSPTPIKVKRILGIARDAQHPRANSGDAERQDCAHETSHPMKTKTPSSVNALPKPPTPLGENAVNYANKLALDRSCSA